MANNISITQGSGTTMATTDVGGVHHQKVRASWGKNGKETSEVKYAVISASSSGDNTIVALVASTVLRVISYAFVVNGTVSVTWKSGASTAKSGAMPFVVNGGMICQESTRGWFETASGEAIVMNLSAAVAVYGHIAYVEEA